MADLNRPGGDAGLGVGAAGRPGDALPSAGTLRRHGPQAAPVRQRWPAARRPGRPAALPVRQPVAAGNAVLSLPLRRAWAMAHCRRVPELRLNRLVSLAQSHRPCPGPAHLRHPRLVGHAGAGRRAGGGGVRWCRPARPPAGAWAARPGLPCAGPDPGGGVIVAARILNGDVFEVLPTLVRGSVDCVVTSPPYWNLPSYLPNGDPLKARELGSEPTPEAYVAAMVRFFRLVRQALADHGTCWVNCGDSYAAGGESRNGLGGSGLKRNVKDEAAR